MTYIKPMTAASDHDGVTYLEFLDALNRLLAPEGYFEIGTESGASAAAFSCTAVCVDPQLRLSADIVGSKQVLHLFQMRSDVFFDRYRLAPFLPKGPDIAFLDGMHRFEYLLRDFINTERQCHPRSLILMHDCLPQNARMALRTAFVGPEDEGPRRFAWTGDVWKIIPILKRYRPDLNIKFLDCPPTGLVAVSRLQPASRVLDDVYAEAVAEFAGLGLAEYGLGRLWEDFPTIDSRLLLHNEQDFTTLFDIY